MNRRSSGLPLSSCFVGFLQYKAAEGLSPRTLRGYEQHLNVWLDYAGDVEVGEVTTQEVRAFIAWLRTDYKPKRFTDNDQPLSPKTVRNFWATLCSFFTWACVEFDLPNPMEGVPAPRFEKAPFGTLSEDEVRALLKACEYSRTWKNRDTAYSRPTADRDRAIILVLVDTGIRAQELCDIKLEDLDLKDNSIRVAGKGRGKDKKERHVRIGVRTVRALWRFLTPRMGHVEDDSWLFYVGPVEDPRKLNSDVLLQLLQRIGERAGVKGVTTHRFRHTFAINYLRNSGDVFTLQRLLGHTTLAMVNRYLRIAQSDCAEAHKKASPVDNWRL